MKLSEVRKISQRFSSAASPSDLQRATNLLESLGIDPSNLYQELEMDSHYVDTHRDITLSNAHVNLHSHTFIEILCCVNTCGVEYLVGADRYRLQKGDIIMVPPGISHRPLLPESMAEPYIRDVMWLNPDFLRDLHQRFPDERIYQINSSQLLRTAGTKWEYLCDLFHTGVLESEHRDAGWEALVAANTVQLLVHLGRAMLDRSAKPLRAEEPELLDLVLAYIEEKLSTHITLADTAKRFFVSESTISHTFKEKMGTSFYRLITQRRLIAAKTLILEGIPMDEVAQSVGFGDYSGFYRAFKQEFGISPRQFRRIQEGQEVQP